MIFCNFNFFFDINKSYSIFPKVRKKLSRTKWDCAIEISTFRQVSVEAFKLTTLRVIVDRTFKRGESFQDLCW